MLLWLTGPAGIQPCLQVNGEERRPCLGWKLAVGEELSSCLSFWHMLCAGVCNWAQGSGLRPHPCVLPRQLTKQAPHVL